METPQLAFKKQVTMSSTTTRTCIWPTTTRMSLEEEPEFQIRTRPGCYTDYSRVRPWAENQRSPAWISNLQRGEIIGAILSHEVCGTPLHSNRKLVQITDGRKAVRGGEVTGVPLWRAALLKVWPRGAWGLRIFPGAHEVKTIVVLRHTKTLSSFFLLIFSWVYSFLDATWCVTMSFLRRLLECVPVCSYV